MWPEVLLGAGRDALDSINKPINRLGALPVGDQGEARMPEGRRSCTLFTVEIILPIIREVQQSLSNVTRRKWGGGCTHGCLDQNPRRDQSRVTHLPEGRQMVGEKGWNYESYTPYREAFSFPLKAVDHFSCRNTHGLQMPSGYTHEYLSPLMREVQAGRCDSDSDAQKRMGHTGWREPRPTAPRLAVKHRQDLGSQRHHSCLRSRLYPHLSTGLLHKEPRDPDCLYHVPLYILSVSWSTRAAPHQHPTPGRAKKWGVATLLRLGICPHPSRSGSVCWSPEPTARPRCKGDGKCSFYLGGHVSSSKLWNYSHRGVKRPCLLLHPEKLIREASSPLFRRAPGMGSSRSNSELKVINNNNTDYQLHVSSIKTEK